MKTARLTLIAFVLGFSTLAHADNLLPLTSFRSQEYTTHCWAYAGAHLLEARAESKSAISTTLDVERDLMYWVLYDRFFQTYKGGQPLEQDLDGNNILTEYGYENEFFRAFLEHGHPIHSAKKTSFVPSYGIPGPLLPFGPFISFSKPNAPRLNAVTLLAQLKKAMTDQEADVMIRGALDASQYRRTADRTDWFGNEITVQESSARVMNEDLAPLLSDSLVTVVLPDDAHPAQSWGTYYNGKYSAYYATRDEMTALADASLEQGWPVMQLNTTHVWTVIGKKGDTYARADSQHGFNISQGFHSYNGTVGISVLKSVLTRTLPRSIRTLMNLPAPKVRIPLRGKPL
jgi:hypothetical protein